MQRSFHIYLLKCCVAVYWFNLVHLRNLEFRIWNMDFECKLLLSSESCLSRNHTRKTPDAIMRGCMCISQFLIYYWNKVTCKLEVGNPWIDSYSLGQWSRGWVGQVNWLMFHLGLLLIFRWWSIHGTEPHILSGIRFSHGSTATQRLDNDVYFNKIKDIHLDFRIKILSLFD